MKHTAFFIIGLSLVIVITGCIKKQQNPVSDAPDAGISSQTDTTEQDDLDNLVVEYCETGNCPCGNGFCSIGSYCIKDMCFCGAKPDKGYFEENTIASNDYGEFECMEYADDVYECSIVHYWYFFICNNDDGCKTADGRKYPKTKTDEPPVQYNDFQELEWSDEIEKIARPGDYSIIESEYDEIIRERFLRENCGPELPEDIKYMEHYGAGTGDSAKDKECNLRQKCNDIGVTADNISEYICDIGRYPHIDKCDVDRLVFTTMYDDDPIGLRCNRPEGCTCGTTHCPNLALCIDGQCKYDLYYQHHTCPGDNWNPNEYDAVNYALQKNTCSLEDYIEACTQDYDGVKDEEDCAEEFDFELCAEDSYWQSYDHEISLKDPCSSQTGQ